MTSDTPSTSGQITYELDGRIAIITIDHEQKRNALTEPMTAQLRSAFQRAQDDRGVRVIILTGAGRAFCSGKDIGAISKLHPAAAGKGGKTTDREPVPGALGYTYVRDASKPVIAAINGAAAGLGLVLALYCDIRIAAANAVFVTSFSRRGLIAEHGIAWILPRLIGVGRAMDMLLASRKVGASEALAMGLVNQVLEPESLKEAARAYAHELAGQVSPRSLRVIKKQIWADMERPFSEALIDARREQLLSIESDDFREGVGHFIENRPPDFRGE